MANTCVCGKVRYATRAAARGRVPRHHRPEERLRPYWCPLCEGWHLTSKRPRPKRASVRRPPRDGRRAKTRPPMSG
jgi:hypothetical protein